MLCLALVCYLSVKFLYLHRGKSVALGSDNMSGILVDMSRHLGNLKYTVWEKMLDKIDYSEYKFFSEVESQRAQLFDLRYFE